MNRLQLNCTSKHGSKILIRAIFPFAPYREAHVGWRSYMATLIARHFLEADGNAEIYLGRESVSRTLTAWPLPHDAPFKRQVDTIMVAVLEVRRW